MLDNKGEKDESLRLDNLNLTIQRKCLGEYHPKTARSMNNIGVAYENKGEYEKALELYQSALVIYEKVFGNDCHLTKKIRDNDANAEWVNDLSRWLNNKR